MENEVVEESRLLETELNGEIHIISFLGNFTKLLVRNVLVNVNLHQEYIDKLIYYIVFYAVSAIFRAYNSSTSRI